MHGVVDINLLHSSAFIEGPLGGGWSGSVSARRSYIDLILPLVLPDNVTDRGAGLLGLPGGREPQRCRAGKLSLFAFGSNDTLKVVSSDPRQGNLDLGIEIGFHKVFAGLDAGARQLGQQAVAGVRLRAPALRRGPFAINESAHVLALRDDLSRQLTSELTLRFGFDGELRSDSIFFNFPLVPDTRLYGLTVPTIEPRTIPLDTAGGGALRRRDLGASAAASPSSPGFARDGFRYVGQNRLTFDPRLVVRWKWNDVHTWKAGAGIYHQMVDPQLLNPEYGNPNLPPIWADQYSIGFLRRLTRKADARHDALLRAPARPAGTAAAVQVERAGALVRHGADPEARVHGAVLRLDRVHAFALRADGLRGQRADVRRQRRGLQDPSGRKPKWFPTDFDQTHNLIAVASYALRSLALRPALPAGDRRARRRR